MAPYEGSENEVDDLVNEFKKVDVKPRVIKKRNKTKVYCAGGKKCGKSIKENETKCPKGHKCNWSIYICTHCETELVEIDCVKPLNMHYCTNCDTRLHGGIANRWSITLH